MNEVSRRLDGNALGGVLEELFGIEPTDAARRCQSCGGVRPLAAHHLYRGSGLVLRCPGCDDVALVATTLSNRHIVHLAGTWRIEVPTPSRVDQ